MVSFTLFVSTYISQTQRVISKQNVKGIWPTKESIANAWGHVFLSVACLLTRQFGKAPKSRSPGIFTYSQYPRDTR